MATNNEESTHPVMIERLVKEPLVHFLVLGGLLFVLYGFFGTGDPAGQRIVITQQDVDRLRSMWMLQWRRLPSSQELAGLIDDYVHEEILYREAVALSLDQDDTVVRRRMVQKIEFLTEDMASQGEIPEGELLSYFAEHRQDYREEARISFSHVYLSEDRRGASTRSDAERLLARLRQRPDSDWEPLGDRFMLQRHYQNRRAGEIDQLFGAGFGKMLLDAPLNAWDGPLPSGYGLHLVRVETRQDSRLPELAEVRARVEEDFRSVRRRQASNELYNRLKERYEIVIDAALPEPAAAGNGQ